jgi:hypothetical protein
MLKIDPVEDPIRNRADFRKLVEGKEGEWRVCLQARACAAAN